MNRYILPISKIEKINNNKKEIEEQSTESDNNKSDTIFSEVLSESISEIKNK